MDGQHPLLKVVEGIGKAEDGVDEWSARFMLGVGVLIRELHSSCPPPGRSRVAQDLLDWADALEADGRSRLELLGRPHLQALPPTARASA